MGGEVGTRSCFPEHFLLATNRIHHDDCFDSELLGGDTDSVVPVCVCVCVCVCVPTDDCQIKCRI